MATTSAKQPGALFRPCQGCKAGKIFRDDAHELCIYCLHEEAHVITGCGICQAFSAGTRRDRAMRVAAHFSTSEEGKKTSSSSSSATHTQQEGDSTEPPSKKRALDAGAGGPRPTHKSPSSTTRSTHADPGSTVMVVSRWDDKHGARKSPSTRRDVPSPVPENRRKSPSTSKPPSTTGTPSAPGPSTTPATKQTETKTAAPPAATAPLTVVGEPRPAGPSTTEERPRVGHKTLPALNPQTTPPPAAAWQQSLDLAMDSMREMVAQHQKTLKKARMRLSEQQEAAKVAKQQEEERLRTLMHQQQSLFREEMRIFQAEAEEREAIRSENYRLEMDDLLRRCERPPSDPLHEMQQRELAALKRKQEETEVVYDV